MAESEHKLDLDGRRILVGVCGGIAAYKSVELVRRLIEAGAEVKVVMTKAATQFIAPLTFQAVSGQRVGTDLLDPESEAAMGHIELARWADHILIAPATANAIARLTHGMADDLLTTLCLATAATITIAPAMNRQMWASPAVAENVERLASRGVAVLGPGVGDQACGEVGPGRMLEPDELVESIIQLDEGVPRMEGVRVLISAGPTYEDLDPVRFIGNRSSGRMGFALARAAQLAGAEVTMVSGPVRLTQPHGVRLHSVRSAAQMYQQVTELAVNCDIFVSCAAVADYSPANVAAKKIKKVNETFQLELGRTKDILASVAAMDGRPQLVVGFAAETDQLEKHASDKLQKKGANMIVANLVGCKGTGFDAACNEVTVLTKTNEKKHAMASKSRLAVRIFHDLCSEYRA
ncbi:MAG: phosphopantothenoylcysteine decarboxylase [Lysobacteraceae bacterium]|nr:MAG: phosphopantothenoylcysteine decarboxylase [Xanthomonadaceae bacterium]